MNMINWIICCLKMNTRQSIKNLLYTRNKQETRKNVARPSEFCLQINNNTYYKEFQSSKFPSRISNALKNLSRLQVISGLKRRMKCDRICIGPRKNNLFESHEKNIKSYNRCGSIYSENRSKATQRMTYENYNNINQKLINNL